MTTVELTPYRHPRSGFVVPVPLSWTTVTDPRKPLGLVAVEPAAGQEFRTNLVVSFDWAPDDDLLAWQAGADRDMSASLPDYLLLDREVVEYDDRTLLHRVAHYTSEDGVPITTEQWAGTRDGIGYTLTLSADTMLFDAVADVFTEIGEGFWPGEGRPPREDA